MWRRYILRGQSLAIQSNTLLHAGRSGAWKKMLMSAALLSVVATTSGAGTLLTLSYLDEGATATKVVEPHTKAAFEDGVDGLRVLGVGLRTKYWFSVYAYAISGEERVIRSLASLGLDDFCKSFVGHPSKKRIELQFQRDITGEDMRSAFQESLGSRTKDGNALATFQEQFRGLKLSTGKALAFSIQYDNQSGVGSVTTYFEGKVLGTVKSTSLVTALLDIYLGANPISSDIKPSVEKRRGSL